MDISIEMGLPHKINDVYYCLAYLNLDLMSQWAFLSHAGTICKLYVYTNLFTDKKSYFKIILSCLYKKSVI